MKGFPVAAAAIQQCTHTRRAVKGDSYLRHWSSAEEMDADRILQLKRYRLLALGERRGKEHLPKTWPKQDTLARVS